MTSPLVANQTEVTADYIKASVWVNRGSMNVQRKHLGADDPDSYFALWWKEFREVLPDDLVFKIWGEPLSATERLTLELKLGGLSSDTADSESFI